MNVEVEHLGEGDDVEVERWGEGAIDCEVGVDATLASRNAAVTPRHAVWISKKCGLKRNALAGLTAWCRLVYDEYRMRLSSH